MKKDKFTKPKELKPIQDDANQIKYMMDWAVNKFPPWVKNNKKLLLIIFLIVVMLIIIFLVFNIAF